ncbi:MAG: DUF2064 domain-containing protein [Alphaproteobacteria bacterium]
MRPRDHLLIFLRAPMLGRVKRRLAADLGPLAALRFYRDHSRALVRRLGRDRRWTTTLVVTPAKATRGRSPWPGGHARHAQVPGDLGRRMARALAAAPPGRVVLVGSDLPDLDAATVAAAFRALGRADLVLGPAADGGYGLIGIARGRRPPPRDIRPVRWSTGHALVDTVAALAPGRRVAVLPVALDDIDDGAGLLRWRRRQAEAASRCSVSRGISSTRLQGR